jgi:hypothetical protein
MALGSELAIARPNYDLLSDSPLIPMGAPELVWIVQLKEASVGWRIDMMIDAKTGLINGISQYR